jgi:hypothetical protein
VLDVDPAALLERKDELAPDELARQLEGWRARTPAKRSNVVIDASAPIDEVVTAARRHVVDALERRAVSRLGAGWVNLPRSKGARWYLPRGPRLTATAALGIYQPMTPRGTTGWGAARALAAAGGFRLLPRMAAPPRPVREALAPYLPPRASVAVARGGRPGRYTAVLLDTDGNVHGLAKLALEGDGPDSLEREAEIIAAVGPRLPALLSAPRVLAQQPGILVLEYATWKPRARPWALPPEVALAMGQLFASGPGECGPTHGDFAPWNLLQTDGGWTLIDWESGSEIGEAFHDVIHYWVQAHALLRRPSEQALIEGLRYGRGQVGTTVTAYADGAGLSLHEAAEALRRYLETSLTQVDSGARHARRAVEVRTRLLRRLG